MIKTRSMPKARRAPSAARITKAAPAVADRMLVNSIGWQQYLQLVDIFAESRVFMTYDDGQLELMKPLKEHERAAQVLDYIAAFVAHYLDIRMART